jgi:hypothetical protein
MGFGAYPHAREVANAEGALVNKSVVSSAFVSVLLFGSNTVNWLIAVCMCEVIGGAGLVYAKACSRRALSTGVHARQTADNAVLATWAAASAVTVYVYTLLSFVIMRTWFACNSVGTGDAALSVGFLGQGCPVLPLGAAAFCTVASTLLLLTSLSAVSDVFACAFASLSRGRMWAIALSLSFACSIQGAHTVAWHFYDDATKNGGLGAGGYAANAAVSSIAVAGVVCNVVAQFKVGMGGFAGKSKIDAARLALATWLTGAIAAAYVAHSAIGRIADADEGIDARLCMLILVAITQVEAFVAGVLLLT